MKKKTARKTRTAAVAVKARRSAPQYSEQTRSFLVHLILYILVNLVLFVYFFSNNEDLTLLYWIIAGWGVGVVAHAMATFGMMKFLHKEW